MSIYSKLAGVLAARRGETWKVGFSELERLIGWKLPASAWKYPAWWSNNPSNNSMTKVWLKAGWRTGEVDVPGETVVFRRQGPPAGIERKAFGLGEGMRPYETKAAAGGARQGAPGTGTRDMSDGKQGDIDQNPLAGLYGCLQGMARVAPGHDLCEPTGEDWEALADE